MYIMKKPILMPIFIGSCSDATKSVLNTGANSQCLEAITTKLFLAKSTFRFENKEAFKNADNWKTAIKNKDIVPLYDVYEPVGENTEASFYETGNYRYKTQKETKKLTCESYLSLCSHKALKSYQNSEYTQVFEGTDNGEVIGVFDSDGIKIKGQDVKDFNVGIRERPTAEKPPTSKITITYRDFEELENNGCIELLSSDPESMMGIFTLTIKLLTLPAATDSLFKFEAKMGCGMKSYAGLKKANLKFVGANDAVIAIDDLTYENGVYTATSAGNNFVTGKLSVDSVQEIEGMLIESNSIDIEI